MSLGHCHILDLRPTIGNDISEFDIVDVTMQIFIHDDKYTKVCTAQGPLVTDNGEFIFARHSGKSIT